MSGRALKDMKRIADGAIDARAERGPSDTPDLLDLLLDGTDPKTKRQMNTAELRDNLLTFIVAGHETTALTLSWALYLMGFDQAVQQKARAEAQTVLQGRAATGADVENLHAPRREMTPYAAGKFGPAILSWCRFMRLAAISSFGISPTFSIPTVSKIAKRSTDTPTCPLAMARVSASERPLRSKRR